MLISDIVVLIRQQLSNMLDNNNHNERERLVIDLYKNQNKSIRDIAKVAKMSFRDIGFILKKEGLSHGLAMTEDDNNNNKKTHPNNEKATQAYKLFSEGKKPVQVAIDQVLEKSKQTNCTESFASYRT